ncbi:MULTISPECIES: LysR family transcriptional regulator [Vibrio]|jgi:DNA-binding transcriptional LysR family regulator|uniref:LysR family transcriptional regulator n=1 Tax=Vibrio natriegens NBRC 15636 = ATCC 14048 = DSM 759 TaxID=1219067 RepID=A0AAN1CYF9_VIBNA|nr:LysR family transcriptional regulator [Vibrio natriegens]MEE3879059.1 LysR family transcriptional regulator [Vibrio sp. YYF0003]ALR17725.1 LysR family transcriptional regulator [Vibrio natriegens NBRC 15636 = ATCC 14048 = DSM 759]ANQ15216.1 LysR family transcriptional regulator [Vibrio natriegens NBRC 15636 = ATCC 14048 = DSM 759]ANQ18851.1 LysR family transcriptional regulator [Vibrio natriegens]ANQ23558.1 LysR family transcriptional regulator [Vibrio natriegens]
MKLPPLRAVHCFESVARNLSFSLAAEELNVTQSAVSHQIRLLEDYLGESLFIRQGRKLSLSDTGTQYLEDISPAITAIAMASQKVREGEKGSIRLAIYSSLAVKWLIPRLSDFKRLHPEIELTLNMMAGDPEQTESVGDCFITVQKPKRNYVSVHLYKDILYPVCSHKLWKEMQEMPMPEAFWQYPLLSTDSVYRERGKDWSEWCKAGGFTLPGNVDMQHFSHMLLAIEAARYDQGIAFANDFMLNERDIAHDLVYIPSHGLDTGDSFYFVHKKSRAKQAEIIKLTNWLKQQCM